MFAWFRKVTFICNHCGTAQRIPLRRIHFFERFQDVRAGQALLIRCPHCRQGLQIPSPYHSHSGQLITINPANLPGDAFIHDTFC